LLESPHKREPLTAIDTAKGHRRGSDQRDKTQGLEGDQRESMRQQNRLQAQRNHTRSNAYNNAQHKHTHKKN